MPFEAAELLDQAAGVLPDVVELRRRIHRHPELGLQLPQTQQAVLDALADLPLSVRTGTALTSVVADLAGGRGDGPTILLRGDMDALPMPEDTGVEYASEVDGTMHACGHDAHTAMLAGAARVLSARRDDFAGTVRFMFQPGEEGFHGARFMIEEGVLDDPHVDAVFGLHVTPNAPSGAISTRGGPIMAAPDVIDIRVRQGWPRVEPVPRQRPDAGRRRDRHRAPGVRDAPHRHVRSRRDHHHDDPRERPAT